MYCKYYFAIKLCIERRNPIFPFSNRFNIFPYHPKQDMPIAHKSYMISRRCPFNKNLKTDTLYTLIIKFTARLQLYLLSHKISSIVRAFAHIIINTMSKQYLRIHLLIVLFRKISGKASNPI